MRDVESDLRTIAAFPMALLERSAAIEALDPVKARGKAALATLQAGGWIDAFNVQGRSTVIIGVRGAALLHVRLVALRGLLSYRWIPDRQSEPIDALNQWSDAPRPATDYATSDDNDGWSIIKGLTYETRRYPELRSDPPRSVFLPIRDFRPTRVAHSIKSACRSVKASLRKAV